MPRKLTRQPNLGFDTIPLLMKVYKMSAAKLAALRPTRMKRAAAVLTLTFGAAAFMAFYMVRQQVDLAMILTGGFTLALIAVVSVFRGLRSAQQQLDEMASTWELVLDDRKLTQRQGKLQEITIDYAAITSIEERGTKGLVIKKKPPSFALGISSAVENYEQLRDDLVRLTRIKITTKGGTLASARTYLALIAVLGLFALSFLSPNRLIAAGASFFLAVISLAAVIYIYRSPHVANDLKRRLPISFIPAAAFLIRGIFLLFHHPTR